MLRDSNFRKDLTTNISKDCSHKLEKLIKFKWIMFMTGGLKLLLKTSHFSSLKKRFKNKSNQNCNT